MNDEIIETLKVHRKLLKLHQDMLTMQNDLNVNNDKTIKFILVSLKAVTEMLEELYKDHGKKMAKN